MDGAGIRRKRTKSGLVLGTGYYFCDQFDRRNYFFAALLVLSGLLLGFFAVKKPDVVAYEINAQGLKIRNRLYPYENIKSFWVQLGASPETNIKPILFINSERAFMPILSIPIEEIMAEKIHSIMLEKNVTEKEMKEHPSEKIMEALGF